MEIWKDVVGYEKNYQVSNTGLVISKLTGKIRKPVLGKRGYFELTLMLNGKMKLVKLHRMIAEAFIPNTDLKPFINHKDSNKQNNKIDNLEWCTNGENIQHAYDNGKMSRKTAVKQLSLSGELIKIWDTVTHTRRYYNMNASNIVQVCKGKRQTAYGFKWEYV